MRVVIGRIGRAHGIRGEVSVELRTDEPERRFAPGSSVFAAADNRPARTLTVVSARNHQGRLLVRFQGVDDRTAAEAIQARLLEVDVDPADRPEDPEEFYDHQLVGLAVLAHDGSKVGVVADVVHLPVQDLLAVTRDADGVEVLVPFVAELVPTIDVVGGAVHIADVPGLLDPDQMVEAGDERS